MHGFPVSVRKREIPLSFRSRAGSITFRAESTEREIIRRRADYQPSSPVSEKGGRVGPRARPNEKDCDFCVTHPGFPPKGKGCFSGAHGGGMARKFGGAWLVRRPGMGFAPASGPRPPTHAQTLCQNPCQDAVCVSDFRYILFRRRRSGSAFGRSGSRGGNRGRPLNENEVL